MVNRCCWCVGAVAMVPLAVILSVFMETPKVMTLSSPEAPTGDTGGDAAAAAAKGESKLSADEAKAAAAGNTMGSGQMFDRIAFAYDSTNKWMTFGLDQFWRRTLVQDCLRLERDDRVLDLATGTADVSLLEGNRLRELGGAGAAAVVGLDPSTEMLRRGVVKAEADGLEGIVRLVKGDAQDLSSVRDVDAAGVLGEAAEGVASGSIDKISMSFGIRNVPDRARALREMRRVLKGKDSRVCILEFSLPTGEAGLSWVARQFITNVIPLIGKLATGGSGGEEYQYLEKSIMNFPKPTDFAASMALEGLPVQSITSFAYGSVHLYAATPK